MAGVEPGIGTVLTRVGQTLPSSPDWDVTGPSKSQRNPRFTVSLGLIFNVILHKGGEIGLQKINKGGALWASQRRKISRVGNIA